MSKKAKIKSTKKSPVPGFEFVDAAKGISEYRLRKNGLRVLHLERKGTGTVTSNTMYLAGSRDETRGETGLAHMLEHMAFKPTKEDLKKGYKLGASIQFQSETGCLLNADTWKDRTRYYFTYPTKYIDQALEIASAQMTDVLLDYDFEPERNNVLSEFDMYNGDPLFALEIEMRSSVFRSHPYGHETIGYREDIEDYTPEKLKQFYQTYYRPDNATIVIVGDVTLLEALAKVKRHFGHKEVPSTPIPRFHVREPKQEGVRRVSIKRPSSTNIVSFGFIHPGLGNDQKGWLTHWIMGSVLADDATGYLAKHLIDTGKASDISYYQEPTGQSNMGMLNITLAPGITHEAIEREALKIIAEAPNSELKKLVKRVKVQEVTEELFLRTHSQKIARELTEYTAAGDWKLYNQVTKVMESITVSEIKKAMSERFKPDEMTIGYFVGTQS